MMTHGLRPRLQFGAEGAGLELNLIGQILVMKAAAIDPLLRGGASAAMVSSVATKPSCR